jgi:flagellar hook-associated protein 3 FlgL
MRVTSTLDQTQFLTTLNQLESNISATQNQITSNLSFTTASQNPVGAGLVAGYNQALAQSQQFVTNSNGAQSSLNTEGTALTQVQTQLQSLRDLALEANSGTVSSQNLSAIATQATQIQSSLVALANTQDGSGNFIFGGFATQTQPFTLTATGATFNGDQGQRQVQIAPGQNVVVGDSGDLVFNQVKTGNGTFAVTAAAGNTGTGVVGATTVSDPAAYTGGTFSINFTAPGTYQVVNTANNAVVTSGTYTSGQTIAFSGLQITLSGQPAAGDSFSVAPSSNQSLFTSVQNLVTALQTTSSTGGTAAAQLSNSINGAINNIDQALKQTQNVQSSVGARLNAITTQQSVASDQQLQLQKSISTLQGLNFASAISTLEGENTTLTAAEQTFAQTQSLSLFKFIQ